MIAVPEKPRRCPRCGAPTDPDHRPFCSRRCKTVDLGRWFNEEYRVPAVEEEEFEEDKE